MKKNKKRNILLGPVIAIIILIGLIILSSAVFSLIGLEGQKSEIINGTIETSLTTVNNVLTVSGMKFILTSAITNLQLFKPLLLIIASLIAIGIGEASGLFKASFTPLKKVKPAIITFFVLFIGIISTFIGEYNYALLLPLVGVLYHYIGRKPMLGILTVFLGMTIGYGTGLVANYDDLILGNLTQISATIDVDKDYIFNLSYASYIMVASTIILAIVGTIIIEKSLNKKVPKSKVEEDELVVSKKALYYSNFAFIAMVAIIIYMLIPGLYGSGLLLGDGKTYIEKLFGETAPLKEGIVIISIGIMMVCGFIYGYISKNIKNSNEYSVGLSKNFEGLGYVFVLMFFTAQMVSLLEWTNLGEVLAVKLIDLVSVLPFSGIPLIIAMFIVVILMSILIPSLSTKWLLAYPIFVPLFMRSNITPDFTQFIFKAADGIGKAITPMFVYFIVMLAFLEKYNTKENNKITVFGTLKLILPCVLLFAGLWLIIIIGWYIIGLPIGPGTYPTL
ncbi:MAG: hypothetical protein E7169_03340 [Firmicutes bacterium]|nr:hypothetical protein [Bacillota bacterium]